MLAKVPQCICSDGISSKIIQSQSYVMQDLSGNLGILRHWIYLLSHHAVDKMTSVSKCKINHNKQHGCSGRKRGNHIDQSKMFSGSHWTTLQQFCSLALIRSGQKSKYQLEFNLALLMLAIVRQQLFSTGPLFGANAIKICSSKPLFYMTCCQTGRVREIYIHLISGDSQPNCEG